MRNRICCASAALVAAMLLAGCQQQQQQEVSQLTAGPAPGGPECRPAEATGGPESGNRDPPEEAVRRNSGSAIRS